MGFGETNTTTVRLPLDSMESMRKLEEFEATLSHGKDLFQSSYGLLIYSLGKRSLADLFQAAFRKDSCHATCQRISRSLCDFAASSLQPLFDSERSFNDVEQIKFFWEVYQLKNIPNLLGPVQLTALSDVVEKLAGYSKEKGIDNNIMKNIPTELLHLIDAGQEWAPSRAADKGLPYFLKDLTNQQTAEPTKPDAQPSSSKLLSQTAEFLDNIASGEVDQEHMKELMEMCKCNSLSSGDALRMLDKFLNATDSLPIYSSKVRNAFFTVLERFFISLSDDIKGPVMKRFYEEWLRKDGDLPSLEAYMGDYSSDITESINGIGDHVEIQNDVAKFKRVRDKLSWYLLTIPRHTIHRLLKQCLDNRLIVPGVLNIFRSNGALFELKVKSERATYPLASVLIDPIISLFEQEAQRWTNTEQQDRLVYLLVSFCRRKRSAAKDDDVSERKASSSSEAPVLSATTLIKAFVLPTLMKRTHEVLMLKILHRLMQTVGAKETRVEWSVEIGDEGHDVVQTPELILLIIELYSEYESSNQQAADICRCLLKSLGEKLKGENLIFKQETCDFILYSLRRYNWWIRYAVCTWFYTTLQAPKQQLPTGLYKCLSLDHQEQCEQISVDFPFSPAECFFRSFFELALFDVELATDFLKKGIHVHPRDENLVEKIALALVDTCERLPFRQPIALLAPLLSELLRVLDPSQEPRVIEFLCESTFHGLRLIQHLLLLATAAKFAYFRANNVGTACSSNLESSPQSCYRAADEFLQAFCELTKAHAEKEVVNFRRSKLPFPPDIKEDILPPAQATIRRDERVYSQLSILFNVACSITRLVPKPPLALQVLINCLAELLFEVQSMRIGTFLDDLPSDHYKSNTVYAVAQPATVPKSPHSSAHPAQGSENKGVQDSAPASNGGCFVENELFDTVRASPLAMESLAAARQISGINMRKNAEKRLLCQGSAAAPTPPLEPRDASGKNGKKKRGAKRR
ncbi:hypothetical protein Q1695_013320 [Nippostrongylus brasiliensis]|nr:hypothetical protein Q1695_013320 [Nippostrongylus brasiliensis]